MTPQIARPTSEERATPRPWIVEYDEANEELSVLGANGVYIWTAEEADDNDRADAALIVEAVNALPALLDRLDQLREAARAFLARCDDTKAGFDDCALTNCGKCYACRRFALLRALDSDTPATERPE